MIEIVNFHLSLIDSLYSDQFDRVYSLDFENIVHDYINAVNDSNRIIFDNDVAFQIGLLLDQRIEEFFSAIRD